VLSCINYISNVFAGAKAYACQCKFRSVNKLMDVSKEKELKWVCGKHA